MRYPGALWRPIDPAFLPGKRIAVYNRMNLHVAVSEAASLHAFFNAKGRASSHFYVRRDGTVEQYVDTDYQAEADLDGNDATISVETQGGVRNANSEPWTDQQVEALAALYAWAHRVHGVPLQIARDARLGSASSRGLSWHRLGIDGNFPSGELGGRLQRGARSRTDAAFMHYSSAGGKVCPGDAKIRQVPRIYARAVEMLNPRPATPPAAAPAPTPPAAPAPPAPTEEDAEMLFIARLKGTHAVYVGNGITRRHVASPQELLDIKWQTEVRGGVIHDAGEVDRIDWLGVNLTPDAPDFHNGIDPSKPPVDESAPIDAEGAPSADAPAGESAPADDATRAAEEG